MFRWQNYRLCVIAIVTEPNVKIKVIEYAIERFTEAVNN